MRINLTLTEFEIHHKIYSSQLLTPSILEFSIFFYFFISRKQQQKKVHPTSTFLDFLSIIWYMKCIRIYYSRLFLLYRYFDKTFFFPIYVLLKIVYFYKNVMQVPYRSGVGSTRKTFSFIFLYFVDNLLEIIN